MKHSNVRSYVLLFLGTVLFFFVINRIFFYSPTAVETVTSYVLYPMVLWNHWVSEPIKRKINQRTTMRALCTENQCLTVENRDLKAKLVELESSLTHMQDVQELLEFKTKYETDQAVLVQVIHKHCADDAHYIIVDAGSSRGIVPDMVAVYKNCLVGRVSEVYPHYSKVMLVTDKRCKISAVCCSTGVHAIHEGINTFDNTQLTHVSHLLQLEANDLIISSGEGLVFPKGFGLGIIEKFDLQGIEYNVVIKPLIDLQCIDHCFLIMKK